MVERVFDTDRDFVLRQLLTTYCNYDKYPCADNLRIAWLGDSDQVREFADRMDNGCCGSYNFSVSKSPSQTYLIGFNYGH